MFAVSFQKFFVNLQGFLKNRCTFGYLQIYWLFYNFFRYVNEFDEIFVCFVSAALFLYFS